MDIDKLKDYFPDSCPKCSGTTFEIVEKPAPVLNTTISDFPHIHCMKCMTNYIAGDLVKPLEKAFIKLNSYPSTMTFSEAQSLAETGDNYRKSM